MNFKKILFPFMAGALALSLAACGGDDKAKKDEATEEQVTAEETQAKLAEQQVDKKEVVAVVNDEEVNGDRYNAVLMSIQNQMQQMGQDPASEEAAEQIKTQTLDTLVNQTLLMQQAKAEEIVATEDEIKKEYDAFLQQFENEKMLEETLKKENMNKDILKEQIAQSIIFQKYQDKITPAEEVSEEAVKEYYDKAAAQAKESEQEFPPFEEVSEEIKKMLQQEEQQKKLIAHLEELKEDAKIELKL